MNLKSVLYFLLSLTILPVYSQDSRKTDTDFKVGVIEQLGKQIPDDIYLTDRNGDWVSLTSQIDKPTAIVLVYFKCPGICSPLLNGLAGLIESSDLELSKDYQVLTIGFDPRETRDLAQNKKVNYQKLIYNKNTEEGWRFFTSDSLNISKLTQALGFLYCKTGTEFTHAATVIIVSPEAKITRYLNGTYFLPYEFELAIKESSNGQTGPTIKKVLDYCYSYDPVGITYVFNITVVTASVTLFMTLLIFLLLVFYKPHRKFLQR